jgi:uncharacterized membrane protein YfcA
MAIATVGLSFLAGLVSGSAGIAAARCAVFDFRAEDRPIRFARSRSIRAAITKAVGSFIHKRANNVDVPALWPLAISGTVRSMRTTDSTRRFF